MFILKTIANYCFKCIYPTSICFSKTWSLKFLVHTIRSTQYEQWHTREINNMEKLKGRYLFSKYAQYSKHKSLFNKLQTGRHASIDLRGIPTLLCGGASLTCTVCPHTKLFFCCAMHVSTVQYLHLTITFWYCTYR